MKAKPPFLCLKPGFDLALGKVLLTGVGTAPSSRVFKLKQYKNFSVKKKQQSSLISKRDNNNISASSNAGSVVQGSLDVFFCEWCYKTCNYLLNRHASFKHLKNLPDHDSSALKGRGSSADFAVRNDIFIDINSHIINNDNSVFKDIGILGSPSNLNIYSQYIGKISYYISNYEVDR